MVRYMKKIINKVKNKEKKRIKISEYNIIEVLDNMINELEINKDEYTANHSKSVCYIAKQIASKMNMSKDEIDILLVGALIHDIGKKHIKKAILKKPSKLTKKEYLIMQNHVNLGMKELEKYDLGKYERAKLVLQQHHERYDGKGYPKNIVGENIDILARIVSVADATQAMFGREYMLGKTKDEIIFELNKEKYYQFDPIVADTMIKILQKEPELIGVNFNKEGMPEYSVKSVREIIGNDKFKDELRSNVEHEDYSLNQKIQSKLAYSYLGR